MTALIGRERECGQIENLLQGARRGEGGSLVLRGEPGIGKTALLEYAAARSGAATVLRVAGVGTESDLAFAGLYGLLRPIAGKLDQLPQAQQKALAGALGLAASPGSDRLLVCAAVLGLIAAAAEDHPVLCLVDDVQWLDRPSADALGFTARRLLAERVAMVFAAREGEPGPFRAPGLPEMLLAGLTAPAAASVLERAAPPATPAVRERLLSAADGNPLALLELPAGLTADQLTGRAALPETLPLTPRLRKVFAERIETLPASARLALLLCAADDTGDLATILRAAAALQFRSDAFGPAEDAGLLQAIAGRVTFRHPLVRSVVYGAAPLSQRQRAHAALAGAMSADNADRRVWHQAMATLTGDEQIAAALEDSARRAQQRAGHASAATAFERAAALTLDRSRLAPRLAAAAQAAWAAGQPERARALITRALPEASQPDHAGLLYLRGVIESACGSIEQAVATQLEAAQTSADPSLELQMLHEAADGCMDTGDLVTLREIGARAAKAGAPATRDKLNRAMVMGHVAVFTGEHERARAAFGDALTLAPTFDHDPQAQLWAVGAARLDPDTEAGLRFATRAVDLARTQGLLSLLPAALNQQARELLRNSRFSQAYAAAEEGYLLSADLGYGWGWHLNTMAWIEAIWGRELDARRHAEQVLAHAPTRNDVTLTAIARAPLGLLALTLGRPAEAARIYLEIPARDRPALITAVMPPLTPDADAIEAIVRAGQPPQLAEAPLARLRAWATLVPSPARTSVLARCEALLQRRPPGQAFTEALENAHAIPAFDRARTELVYGEWLRRQRQRGQARTHLHTAAGLFRTLGTTPWATRAEAELRATGETVPQHHPPALDQLTPQQLKIAGLVADGLTNRDIASQLFLSPRTIDYHLSKIFTKLGIASRAELIRYGAAQRHPQQAPGGR